MAYIYLFSCKDEVEKNNSVFIDYGELTNDEGISLFVIFSLCQVICCCENFGLFSYWSKIFKSFK